MTSGLVWSVVALIAVPIAIVVSYVFHRREVRESQRAQAIREAYTLGDPLNRH